MREFVYCRYLAALACLLAVVALSGALAAGDDFTIQSPPVAGFVPHIVVGVTDERLGELELDAIPTDSVVGRFLTSNPKADYAIGLLDTGAGACLLGATDAVRTGLFDRPDMLTANTADVIGASGTCPTLVSQPLGLFVAGLHAIDANGLLSDELAMVGEANISVGIGDPVESPGVPTAIGTPLLVYFTSVIDNTKEICVYRDDTLFLAPDVRVYEPDDPRIPHYPNRIPMELRPAGAVAVQYFPNIFGEEFEPLAPSLITGFLPTQSLFFVSSVDVNHRGRSALDKDGFMLDTAAQFTVVSELIAARLGLDLQNPQFEIDISDACGGPPSKGPGFIIDSLLITAVPEWLTYTNVPVVVLDLTSPEGGVLDGIIGMNLFDEFNLVIRGGGLAGQDPPVVEFQRIPPRLVGDIAPIGGDGVVDHLDLAAFGNAWLSSFGTPNWYRRADMGPPQITDEVVDSVDFAVFAAHWQDTNTQ